MEIKKYVFKKYNQSYKEYFQYEKNKIRKALGNQAQIEHVGSTAVNGLGGKGIVDIVVGVKKNHMDKTKSKLENAGYEYRAVASVPGRIFFRKDYVRKNKIRRVHIHLVNIEAQEWQQIIVFRNYLINNPEAVKEYAALKKQAVKTANGDGKLYRKLKNKFIKKVIENN
ncbi:MAG: GrpB family protein [Patescibacteria group bacterium]|jgi:GrpB-like predicted nucleotidyltransferase (UPF0157 family)